MPIEPPPGTQPKPRRLRRTIGRILFGLFVLIILAAIAENLRGHWLWRKYRQELAAKGEVLDVASLAPKPVAPEQNFATTPFFAPFLDYTVDLTDRVHPQKWRDEAAYSSNKLVLAFSAHVSRSTNGGNVPGTGVWQLARPIDLKAWRDRLTGCPDFPISNPPQDPARDLLNALRRYDAVLEELNQASRRPESRFPVHYEENLATLLPHLEPMRGAAQIVHLRALANLEAGQTDAAFADVQFGFRLAECLKSERYLISGLVRLSLAELQVQVVWEGFARRRWSEAQARELQATIEKLDVLADHGPIMRMERATAILCIEEMRQGISRSKAKSENGDETSVDNSSLPGGLYSQNQLSIARYHQEKIIPLVDAVQHRVDVAAAKALRNGSLSFHPYRIFADLLLPSSTGSAQRFARVQVSFDLARVACALERRRMVEGSYPPRLEDLSPKYIATIPTDVVGNGPLRYQSFDNGKAFTLYSVGWNEVDDGGTPGRAKIRNKDFRNDPNVGDWVWTYSGF